jgi:hypothetical protein
MELQKMKGRRRIMKHEHEELNENVEAVKREEGTK